MLRTFKKKPVVVEAYEWDGQLSTLMNIKLWGAPIQLPTDGSKGLVITTLEDGPDAQVRHYASVGDFIVKGTRGEFYPIKPQILADTYEEVFGGAR